ncbi:hypothetical protein [Gloeocapsopsis dulcis]|uniref:Phage tail protein n=1 Tax=Gloeocapsopsis dulcis AAB1 = 1H9 TaxID=1433147 RepID=A0A6N8FNL8_9CHRO|nr:hypothetical protein [Gloeocapsopsis dulcis]MUL34953.1 hypothetical protein [Gloeocapsopsis dulcis AAB1 = 1H9]WNN89976.1 hypothetical protein P0S91_02435 [Gloeocapsopsis dulcis]
MNNLPDRLYNLLPGIYRQRDAERGFPLQALLQVVSEQVDVVEADITQLYENWFIETCQDWVIPYIGDLIGYQPVHNADVLGEENNLREQQRQKILTPRREVANTIRYRRRKGALTLLELLAYDVAGWPARAVEFYQLLGFTQAVNHLKLERGLTLDLHQSNALAKLYSPFNELAHTVDIRRLNSQYTQGYYNLLNVGVFVWRLKPYSVTKAPAYCLDRASNRYTFSILGNDTQLFTLPVEDPEPTHVADETNVPAPISRQAFTSHTADYYGVGKSLCIFREQELDNQKQLIAINSEDIVPADLSDWTYQFQDEEQIAIDPELGRIAFSPRKLPKQGIWVSYHYGFSADIGGGEYEHPLSTSSSPQYVLKITPETEKTPDPSVQEVYCVRKSIAPEEGFRRISGALDKWRERKPLNAIIEIIDNSDYVEQMEICLEAGQRLELRAGLINCQKNDTSSNRTRPTLRLLDWSTNRPDAMRIMYSPQQEQNQETQQTEYIQDTSQGEQQYRHCGRSDEDPSAPRVILDGLLIAGRGVQIVNQLAEVRIRHCTLVPGWSLDVKCEPTNETEPSLELINTSARITVEQSIIGSIQVTQDEVKTDPISIHISDSILDATNCEYAALSAPTCLIAHATLTILRSTVFGRVKVHAIKLAENCILNGQVNVARSQLGCMRFCYVLYGSRTPRRYNCQPDLVEQAVVDESLKQQERDRVRPQFNSTRYGTPTYCQLAAACAEEIKHGADDESEMGVFHDLYQPQREINLRTRLNEYTPVSMEVGMIYAT